MIIDKYPEADLYDRALKNLAEIYVNNMEYKKAVLYLQKLLYVNNLYKKTGNRCKDKRYPGDG